MKLTYLTIIAGSIIAIILVIIALFSSQNPNHPSNISITSPTPIKTNQQEQNTFSPTISQRTVPETNDEKLLDKITNRQPLSDNDTQVKKTLIGSLAPHTETIYATDTFRVVYVYVQDLFMVEILTIDTQKAKSDAVAWFKSQGMSFEGICKLPISFFPSFDTNQQLKSQGAEFNPLTEGC